MDKNYAFFFFVKWEQGDCERGVEKSNWLDCPASTFQAGQLKDLKTDSVGTIRARVPLERLRGSLWARTPSLKTTALHGCH